MPGYEVRPDEFSSNDRGVLSNEIFKMWQELIRESVFTDPTGGMYVIDELSNAVHIGNAFSITASGTVASGQSVYLLGKVGSREVHFDRFHINSSQGEFTMTLYEGPTITSNGTPVSSTNRKRNSANTATMSTYSGTSVSNDGVALERTVVYDTGGVGSNLTQGAGQINADWVLAENTDYIIKITNNGSTNLTFNGNFIWAER